MTLTFAHPPHPAELAAQTSSSTSGSLSLHASDPHQLPDFKSSDSRAPVLYLPPLLSSLPEGYKHDHIKEEGGHAPLVTETRLPDIDPASLSLHKALHNFRPLDGNYAATAYADAFNWDELSLPEDHEREWYCVVFRSRRKPGSNGDSLYEADKKAHEEAVTNGGLIMYWYGIPDQKTGMNLATCIWQSRKHSMAASSRPNHIRAMRLAAEAYEVYDLERHVLRKHTRETTVSIEPFTGGDVGW